MKAKATTKRARNKPAPCEPKPVVIVNQAYPDNCKFTQFAVDNDLVLIVNEVPGKEQQWVCNFDTVVALWQGMLVPVFGQGDTPDKALENYRKKIAGHTLVADPNSAFRKEMTCPRVFSEDLN